MAEPTFEERVAGALKGLEKALAGQPIPFGFEADLQWVERFLGLKRPLASYAPRTRRRYIAAAKAGDRGAQKTLTRERSMRTDKNKAKWGLTAHQLTQLNKYRIPIINSGVEIREYLDPDVIKEVVTMYGFKYMMKVLRNQYDSIVQFTKNNPEPGRRRWNSRGELEEEARNEMNEKFAAALIYHVKGTDPYYYYHGHIR